MGTTNATKKKLTKWNKEINKKKKKKLTKWNKEQSKK